MPIDFDYKAARAAGYSDDTILSGLKAKGMLDFDVDKARKDGYSSTDILGTLFADKPVAPPASRSWAQAAGDTALDLAVGTVGLGESVVGLSDIATFGAVGKGLEAIGYDAKRTKEFLSGLQSDQRQKSDREVAAADGFWETAKAIGVRPDVLIGNVVQSLPGTLGSGAAAGLLVRKLGTVALTEAGALGLTGEKATAFVSKKITEQAGKIAAAAAAGEGAQTAGSIAEGARASGRDWNEYVLPSLGAGLGTAAINMVSGGLGRKLGIGDVETSLAQRAAGAEVRGTTARGIAARVPMEAVKEGVLEEAPQSYQEQVFQNIAMGEKDITKDASKSAATGMLAGMAMGGTNAAITPPARPDAASPAPEAAPLLLENRPDPFISFPDGSVGRQADVDSFIAALPESDRIAARARLYGLAEQSAQTPTPADIMAPDKSVDEAIATAETILTAPTEFDADLRNQQIDAAFGKYMSEIRQQEFDLAEQARRDADVPRMESQVRDEKVDLANAITEAQGFDTREPTAMELAMRRARTVATPMSKRGAIEAPVPAAQAAEAIPQDRGLNEIPAVDAPVRNDGLGGAGNIAQEQSNKAPGLAPVQPPAEVGGNDGAAPAASAVRADISGADSAMGKPAALTPEQSIEQARAILSTASVKGKERLDVLAQVRDGSLSIADLQDAYEQPANPQSTVSLAKSEATPANKADAPSRVEIPQAEVGTAPAARRVESAQSGSSPNTSAPPVESIQSEYSKKAPPVKDKYAGETFKTGAEARTFVLRNKIASTHRVEQTGREKFEIRAKPDADAPKKSNPLDAAAARDAKIESQLATANANAAKRKESVASLDSMSGKELREVSTSDKRAYMRNAAADILQTREQATRAKRSETGRKLWSKSMGIEPERDTMAQAIAKMGGVSSESAKSRLRLAPEELSIRGKGVLRVFTSGGKTMDEIGAAMADLGYVERDENGKHDQRDFEDKLAELAGGADILTPQGMMIRAEENARAAQEETGAQSREDYEQVQDEADSATDAVEAAITEAFDNPNYEQDLSDEEIDRIFGIAPSGSGVSEVDTAGAPRQGGEGNQAPQFSLASESADEGRARVAQEEDRAKAEQKEEAEAAKRERQERDGKEVAARMDASAENFQLGQSAEDGLSGQEPLWSKSVIGTNQTGTPAFQRWFGDSVVVDKDGAPMVMYHGSKADFSTFDKKFLNGENGRSEGSGFYFTSDKNVASAYAKGKLFEVYLSIKKPLAYDAKAFTQAQMKKIIMRASEIEAQENESDIRDGFLANFGDTYSSPISKVATEAAGMMTDDLAIDQLGGMMGAGMSPDILNQALFETLGYDGYSAKGFSNEGMGGGVIFIAMEPSQIKSATENNGDFDASNPDIRYSKEGLRELVKSLEQKYLGLKFDAMDSRSGINISRIVVPEGARGQGIGTAVMKALIEYADQNGKTLTLSPSADFGGSVLRLKKFYKALGFVENTGRSKDFEISESMYRLPTVRKSTGPATPNAFTATSILPALDTALKRYGKDFVKNLLATGKVKIVTSKEAALVLGSQPEGPAFFNPKTGLTYIVADRIGKDATPEQLHGLVLHEVANHALQMGKSSAEFKALLKNFAMMEKAGNPKVKAAFARADDAGASAALRSEEGLGYYLEENPDLSLSQRFIAWLRSGIRALGQSLPAIQRAAWFKSIDAMSVNDLVYAAQNVLQGAPSALAETQEQIEGQPAFSKAAGRTIEVDGVRRPITNSKGQRITDDFAKQKAFWNWFGSSAVVDSSGKPLVVYHGTDQDFNAFTKGVVQPVGFKDLQGHYFTREPEYAGDYGATVMPVYLSMQNPYMAPSDQYEHTYITPERRAELEKDGYDGMIFEGNGRQDSEYVIFDSTKIKSATGNSGTFDPTNADIRYSKSTMGDLTAAQEAAYRRGFGTPKTFAERLKEFTKDWQKNVVQGVFDVYAPVKELSQKAYIQLRMSKGGDSTLEALMLYGKVTVDADGFYKSEYKKANGKQGFAESMAKLQGEHDRFLVWVSALRADSLKKIGLENLMTQADIDTLKGLNKGRMKSGDSREALYLRALADLNEFNDSVLKIASDSGLIDDSTRKMYKDTPYVPFYRLQENDGVAGFGMKAGAVNQTAWKKLKGGTDKLNEDLLANLLQNWSHLITASAKNRAAKTTLDAAVSAGIAQQIPNGAPGKGHVKYRENGTDKTFILSDDHIMDALIGMEYAGLGPWAAPLTAMKRWLTIGVTVNPAFKVRNLIRDSVQSIGIADVSYNPYNNITAGWAATAEGSETRAQMLASGGMIRFGSMLDGSSSDRAKQLIKNGVNPDHILDDEGKVKKLWDNTLGKAFDAYQELGDRGEQVNRAALYERLLAKGMSQGEAAYLARDMMDFSSTGKWVAIRFLTQVVPFMNARLQGLYKLGRASQEGETWGSGAAQFSKRMGYTIGTVALASIALMLAYQDDDDWNKREDSDRQTYWWFKIGGIAYRIPKPFEIGSVGTIAEMGVEMFTSDEMDGKRFSENLGKIVGSQLSMNPIPQLVKPMLDVYANKDSFTERPIENMAMQRLQAKDRYTERTSEVARFLGSLGLPDPVMAAMGHYNELSPVKVDALIRGYFSWIGTMATTALDYGIRPMMDRGSRPAMRLEDVFLAGNFVKELPASSSRYVSKMYDQAAHIEQAYASYHEALKLGDVGKAKEIMEANRADISKYSLVQKVKRAESSIGTQMKLVTASRTLTPDQKRKQLDALNLERDRIARALD